MSFAHPVVLLALVVPIALLAWVWRRAGRRLVLPFDFGRAGRGRGWFVALNLAECIPALVLAAVILILAGPLQTSAPKTKRALTNIELCVDVSGSMSAPFGDGTRYDVSMKAIDDFLNYRKGDAFGLTFFGNLYLHWVPLTSDVSAIRCAPALMRPEIAPPGFGGTEIGKALRACRKVLADRQEGDRLIILISDGDSADFWGGNDIAVAKELKADRIVVYSVHISDERVPDSIANVTALTGGEVFHPGDPDALKAVFQRIDKMHQTKLEKSISDTMDDFWPYCLAGLVLVGLGTLSLFGMRYTPW